tara:strand:- start:873 stop:1097 length:225 start_codon:yes stop_codon:yes gene_type:complete
MSNESKVISLVSEVLDVEKKVISINTTIDDIDVWDSMMTVNIMTVVCDEFGLTPSFEDFEQFTSVKTIIEFIEK